MYVGKTQKFGIKPLKYITFVLSFNMYKGSWNNNWVISYFIVDDVELTGCHRSLRDFFTEERDRCVNYNVTETNKLIMRLDKLMSDRPPDIERKNFEKDTVPWVADSVPACQLCAVKFHLVRRRHHCRLCGSVVCKSCTLFLSLDVARKLLDPNIIPKDELTFRICTKCDKLLQRRSQAIESVQSLFIFKDLYEKLCQLLIEASNLAPSYKRMVTSLQNGESLYTLDAAINLRKKLVAIQHEIQTLIERIENWGLNDDPMAERPTPREFILRSNIRYISLISLKESFQDLSEPPSLEEYKQLQIKYREKLRFSDSFSTNSLGGDRVSNKKVNHRPPAIKTSASFSGIKAEDGWTPEPVIRHNPFTNDEEMDPLQQQYLILKNFLKQAAESGRLEEIEILEKNIVAIEDELGRMNLTVPS
uniref:FYVE-type domain-containing protein n=1 Tax=Panagrolaimus sp. JU765 TaxID=591449 RepID=A0AC34Q9H9_9BILA